MSGFKMSLDLSMPESRPEDAPLCEECSMKHASNDDCWEGILPAGMLPLPTFDKNMTGRELIDEDKGEALLDKVKKHGLPIAKNVKVTKKAIPSAKEKK